MSDRERAGPSTEPDVPAELQPNFSPERKRTADERDHLMTACLAAFYGVAERDVYNVGAGLAANDRERSIVRELDFAGVDKLVHTPDGHYATVAQRIRPSTDAEPDLERDLSIGIDNGSSHAAEWDKLRSAVQHNGLVPNVLAHGTTRAPAHDDLTACTIVHTRRLVEAILDDHLTLPEPTPTGDGRSAAYVPVADILLACPDAVLARWYDGDRVC